MSRSCLALLCAVILVLASLAAPAPAAAATGPNDTLAEIAARGQIVLGHRMGARPFSFVDGDGTVRGYTIDLCLEVVEEVRRELQRPDLAVAYLPITADDRFDRLLAGDIDLLCGVATASLARLQRVDFSSLTFVTGATLLTRADSPVETLADLAGRTIGVIADTTTQPALHLALERQAIAAEIVVFHDHGEALTALDEGRLDAFAGDRIVLIGLLRNSPDPGHLRLAGGLFSHEPFALALRPNDHRFRTLINRTLSRTYSSPAIADIYERWFGAIGARPSELLRSLYLLQTFPE